MPESSVNQQSQPPGDWRGEAQPSDTLLSSYLQSTDEAESERLAAHLISEYASQSTLPTSLITDYGVASIELRSSSLSRMPKTYPARLSWKC
jgi:hypothetical protein